MQCGLGKPERDAKLGGTMNPVLIIQEVQPLDPIRVHDDLLQPQMKRTLHLLLRQAKLRLHDHERY